jgi:hypothetical protein
VFAFGIPAGAPGATGATGAAGTNGTSIQPFTAIAHKWINAVDGSGNASATQPAASDITGLATVATSGLYSDLTGKPTLAASATTDTTNASNISSGTLPAGRLPNPSASTLGGVQSAASVSHQFLTGISTLGVPSLAQPAFSDISGTAAAGQLPFATVAAFGAVKPDGTTITISAGVISAVTSGTGTVTSFSAGSLSPLFTTSVATATSTPALTFTLSNAPAHTFLGNTTGLSAAPSYSAITVADLPQLAYSSLSGLPTLAANTTATASQFFTAYNSATGAFTKAQPAFTDISGTVAAGQLPTATASTLGAVKVDGTTITISAGVISAAAGSGTVNTGTINQTAYYAGAGTAVSGVGPGTAGQIYTSGGAGAAPSFINFPETKFLPAANCSNTTPGYAWSLPAANAPTVACRTGTNTNGGVLQFAAASTAQLSVPLPLDWNSAVAPNIRLYVSAATDVTSGHTIIMQVTSSCSKSDGSTTDDVAFNTPQSLSTVTLNTTANATWTGTLTGITTTGCSAGGILRIKVSRTTDTATGTVNVSGIQVTIPRLLAMQAN